MFKFLSYFKPKPKKTYWDGRAEGWFDCENMIFSRIKKYYPNQYEEMIKNLLQ